MERASVAWFTYSFRDKTGKSKTDFIEASSRNEAFARLRNLGVIPISLKEGRAPSAPRSEVRRGRFLPICLAALAVVGIGTWWALRTDSSPDAKDQLSHAQANKPHKSLPAEAKRVRNNSLENPEARQTNSVTVIAEEVRLVPKDQFLGQDVVSRNVRTNGTRVVEKILTADGKSHMVVNDLAKPVFDNPSDQVLGMALSAPAGQGIAPLPMTGDLEREFRKSLEHEIVIADDDSPKVKALKMAVIQAREDMKAMLDQGMTMQDIMREHQKLANENADMRNSAVSELKRLLADGDYESATKYAGEVNQVFRQMGIMELSMPPRSAAEHEQLKEERRAARNAAHDQKQKEGEVLK